MLRNYLKIALRNLWKERLFSMISIIGLAAGLAVSIIIMQFVVHEWSYDKFHENGENIYRVLGKGENYNFPWFSSKLGGQLAQENPDIKVFTRIYKEHSTIIKNPEHPELLNEESGFIFADPSLFSVFTFPLKYGNVRNVLEKPFTVVISEKMADKYFGKENPVGKSINYNGEQLFEISGVAQNVPTNSTITFDFVSSHATFLKMNEFGYENYPNYETYLLIDRKDAIPKITQNIKAANKLIAAMNYQEKDYYELEPFFSLRLGDSYTSNEKPGQRLLYVLSGIAGLILALALFNYINLATARATLRAKEVGVRKAIGAKRSSLVGRFFLESALVTFLAFILSFVLVVLFREPFNNLFGLKMDFSFLISKVFVGVLFGLFACCTLLTGIYPALILSGFSPLKVLKGNYIMTNQGTKARSTMLVFQFSVSATLILCSIIIDQQIRFMKDKDLGFNREQMLNVELSKAITQKSNSFKKDVESEVGNENVSLSNTSFFKGYGVRSFKIGASDKVFDLTIMEADADFVKTIGAKWLVEPTKDAIENKEGFCITVNEAAVKKFGYTNENVMGQTFFYKDGLEYGKVTGVIRNFYLTGVQKEIQPMLFLMKKPTVSADGFRSLLIHFHPQDHISEKIAVLEKLYHQYDPGTPFRYSFLDDDFQKSFIWQTRISYMVQVFTAVAISLSCLGLLGLITFIGQTRSKEISIRKVMGASVTTIFVLLSKHFLFLVLVSVLTATPVAYYFMQKWLQNFDYRIEISWWVFAAGGLASLVIALLAISYQGFKAALSNPVDALRSE